MEFQVRQSTIRWVARLRRWPPVLAMGAVLLAAFTVVVLMLSLLSWRRAASGTEPQTRPVAAIPTAAEAPAPPLRPFVSMLASCDTIDQKGCLVRVGPGNDFAPLRRSDQTPCVGRAGQRLRVRGAPLGEWVPVLACGLPGYVPQEVVSDG